MKATCKECKESFEAQRSTAEYCGVTCRSRARRKRRSEPTGEESDLELQVRAELEGAGRLECFNGQLALQLARKMSAVDATGVASLSKELRTVMDAALAGANPAPADEPAEAAPEVDEVQKARRRRDDIARAAAGSA